MTQKNILFFLTAYSSQIERLQEAIEKLQAENAQIPKEEQDPKLTEKINSFYRLT